MNAAQSFLRSRGLLMAVCVVAYLVAPLFLHSQAADEPGRAILPVLQERLGLSDPQVRGALGALLVFVRERLPKPEFDDLVETIPNAHRIMQDVKLRGIVNGPLDDLDDYEAALSNIGIGQPLASQFVPAVLQALGETAHLRERNILAREFADASQRYFGMGAREQRRWRGARRLNGSCGDVATQEALAARAILREHLTDLKVHGPDRPEITNWVWPL